MLESTSPLTYSEMESGDRKDVQEIARPDILEERHRHSLHDAGKEVPQENGSQQGGHEIKARRGHRVQVLGDESPQNHVNGDPNEQRQYARGTPAHQIELAKQNGCGAAEKHKR